MAAFPRKLYRTGGRGKGICSTDPGSSVRRECELWFEVRPMGRGESLTLTTGTPMVATAQRIPLAPPQPAVIGTSMKRYLSCPSCHCVLTCEFDVLGRKVKCTECSWAFVPAEYCPPPLRVERAPSPAPTERLTDRPDRTQHLEQGIPQERLWVGSIMGLILCQIEEFGTRNLNCWTIIIDEDRNEPYLKCGRTSEGCRRSELQDCPSFQMFRQFATDPTINEMICQDLAFDICRKIEPEWDQICRRR